MAAGAVSLKLPNFLTTSQDVTKGADQAIYEPHIRQLHYFVPLLTFFYTTILRYYFAPSLGEP